ncbi:MAG: HNH endonuclease signature motif containing protein [Verrucomicrobiota bacterium]
MKKRAQASRFKAAPHIPDPDEPGTFLCSCGCGRKPTGRRKHWFSEECHTQWSIENRPAAFRKAVRDRDKTVCAECGVNTNQERSKISKQALQSLGLTKIPELWIKAPDGESWIDNREVYTRYIDRANQLAAVQGWPPVWVPSTNHRYGREYRRNTWWQADHIVEYAEEGPNTLANAQTLCSICHAKKTAAYARERSERQAESKGEKTTNGEQPELL